MKIDLRPGKYVVAVSGGVDSVVLLDLFVKAVPKDRIVVAHFDHGIRKNSAQDRKFTESLARRYNLEFFAGEGKLGSKAGEAVAREKRYAFLNNVLKQTGSDSVATAHHQDDVLETVIINIIRGTGRKGLSSLKDRPHLSRPLLRYKKSEILAYARKNNLTWREDETNIDEKYLRNYIRHSLIGKLDDAKKQKLLDISKTAGERNKKIDELIENLFFQKEGLPRNVFVGLPHDIASEVIAQWLRRKNARLDKKTVERLVVQLKTARTGKTILVNQSRYFVVENGIIRLKGD